jgi:hypothetical protein
LLEAILGTAAQREAGKTAKGPATNAERNSFLSERLLMDLFFIG